MKYLIGSVVEKPYGHRQAHEVPALVALHRHRRLPGAVRPDLDPHAHPNGISTAGVADVSSKKAEADPRPELRDELAGLAGGQASPKDPDRLLNVFPRIRGGRRPELMSLRKLVQDGASMPRGGRSRDPKVEHHRSRQGTPISLVFPGDDLETGMGGRATAQRAHRCVRDSTSNVRDEVKPTRVRP